MNLLCSDYNLHIPPSLFQTLYSSLHFKNIYLTYFIYTIDMYSFPFFKFYIISIFSRFSSVFIVVHQKAWEPSNAVLTAVHSVAKQRAEGMLFTERTASDFAIKNTSPNVWAERWTSFDQVTYTLKSGMSWEIRSRGLGEGSVFYIYFYIYNIIFLYLFFFLKIKGKVYLPSWPYNFSTVP